MAALTTKKSVRRPKGSPSATTANLAQAVLLAAELVGADGKGKGGLDGYLTKRASDPASSPSLVRALALQMTNEVGGEDYTPAPFPYTTSEEIDAMYRRFGISWEVEISDDYYIDKRGRR